MVWYLVRGSKVWAVLGEDCVVETKGEDLGSVVWVRAKIKGRSAVFRVGTSAFLIEDDADSAVVRYLRREVGRCKRALATAQMRLKAAVNGGNHGRQVGRKVS